jgi:hypothetical protein
VLVIEKLRRYIELTQAAFISLQKLSTFSPRTKFFRRKESTYEEVFGIGNDVHRIRTWGAVVGRGA